MLEVLDSRNERRQILNEMKVITQKFITETNTWPKWKLKKMKSPHLKRKLKEKGKEKHK